MDDCVNMPYTNAVIHESLRMGNVVPLSLLHATGRDIQLEGYTIPKVLCLTHASAVRHQQPVTVMIVTTRELLSSLI